MTSAAKFLIFSDTLWHDPLDPGQVEVPEAERQRSQTLWPLLHMIHIGGRRYFLHLLHLNFSVKDSGRQAGSTFDFFEISDIIKK